MLGLYLKKALRDLMSNKSRALLVLIAMIIGITGVGAVLDARAILSREMDYNYMRTNPASATLWVDKLNDQTMQQLGTMTDIKDVEARKTIEGRIQKGEEIGTEIKLFVVKDFNDIKTSIFATEKGKWPPEKGEILIERAAMNVAKAAIGDSITVKVPDLAGVNLKIVGTVHAPALAPAWMEGMAYGFISLETYKQITEKADLDELKFVVSENQMDKDHIRDVTYKLKGLLDANGQNVERIEIPKPGKHPHASQMETLLFLLEAFGILTFILGAIIVTNMIAALLSQQIRQIGIMKAVGGKNNQIASIYICMVLGLGVMAVIISIPLGTLAGRVYSSFCAEMLNFQIYNDSIPIKVYLIQVAIALILPFLAVIYSVVKGSRVTVRQALQDYGVSLEKNMDIKKSLLSGISIFSRPFLLSIRNTFRKKGRLIFTMAVLAVGGALFITSLNVYASMNKSALSFINSFKYDASVRLSHSYQSERLETSIRKIEGIRDVEIWGGFKTARVHSEGLTGNSFNVLAIPTGTRMVAPIDPELGRWLIPSDTNAIVINHMILTIEPDLKVGDTIYLKVSGKEYPWKIVGIATEILSEPKAYVNQDYFERIIAKESAIQNIVVSVEKHDSDSLNLLVKKIQKQLQDTGYDISIVKLLRNIQEMVENHLLLLAAMLIIMSVLGLIVGGLGLSTTMSINIIERTREIGIMKAIGASTKALYRIIIGESVSIGILSWIIAVGIAIPFSSFISSTFGNIFFETPLKAAVSYLGIVLWLLLSVVFATLSSLYPAKKASSISVRESLAYE